jgi:adenylate cyclase
LVLPELRISRRHAMIHTMGTQFCIVDLGSSNGTSVNERRIQQPTMLRPGDSIQIGSFTFVFYQDNAPPLPEDHKTDCTVCHTDVHDCWFLIADIEGFTRLTQCEPPANLNDKLGAWFTASQKLIEEHGGILNKFLGDGFFAYWHDDARNVTRLANALRAFQDVQSAASMPFRLVVHRGSASFSGRVDSELILGSQLNFAFRMEKIAKTLGTRRMLSEPASRLLSRHISTRPLGSAPVDGFDGTFHFFAFD